MKPIYQATKTRSNRPGWSVIFRHPKRSDSRGRPGLKVRKGLGTQNEAEAEQLVNELNLLLSDQRWWSNDRRREAEQQFKNVVVSAFFDGLEAGKISSSAIREGKIPLPTQEDGYSRIMLTGTTGAGKTTVLRHLIGSDHENDRFPSTSTARTTTAEIEIVTAEGDYEAVVTFMPEHEVRAHIEECIEEACLSAIQQKPEEKIVSSLLSHREQRFRLSYILGQWEENDPGDEDEFSFDDHSTEESINESETVSRKEAEKNREQLVHYLKSINELTIVAGTRVDEELGALEDQKTPDDKATWLEIFSETLYEEDEFGRLALDLMEEVEDRFDFVSKGKFKKGPTGWPSSWDYACNSREEFLEQIRWFSSNHYKQFGKLLTPLVDGLRVRGPFFPRLAPLLVAPKLVLLDGEGIGHTAKSASSISTRVTRKFSEVDMILVVDNAEQPMQSAPLELLRSIGNSGHADKLAVTFTHFDQVKGGVIFSDVFQAAIFSQKLLQRQFA